MRKINPNKVFTEYRDDIEPTTPLLGRRYTMTHSDTTGELFVILGKTYANDYITPMHDEVLLEWRMKDSLPYLYGEVLVDGESVPGNPALRNAIFVKQMPTALQAVRYGDDPLFKAHPELDEAPIYIYFNSTKPQFNKLRYFGPLKQYHIPFSNRR